VRTAPGLVLVRAVPGLQPLRAASGLPLIREAPGLTLVTVVVGLRLAVRMAASLPLVMAAPGMLLKGLTLVRGVAAVTCCDYAIPSDCAYALCFLCNSRAAHCSALVGERTVVISMSVYICPHGYLQNHVTDLHRFLVHVASSRCSVLLWWRCNTLCTSGFADDVMFSHSGPCSAFQQRGGV